MSKWQAKGGDWLMTACGVVIEAPLRGHSTPHHPSTELKTRRRPTKKLAEVAARQLRTMEVLLAYRDEHCPDHNVGVGHENCNFSYAVFYSHKSESWVVSSYLYLESPTMVYFPYEVANELARKLNNGEIEI